MLIKISGDGVKFIGSKYLQGALYSSTIITESTFTLHNISLGLIRSRNTLNP